MILVVSGSRNWKDGDFISATLDFVTKDESLITLIHGDAKGADHHAKVWANLRGIKHIPFIPRWDELGPSAGPVRNKDMIDAAIRAGEAVGEKVILVAFRLANSKGTTQTIDYATRKGVERFVIDR